MDNEKEILYLQGVRDGIDLCIDRLESMWLRYGEKEKSVVKECVEALIEGADKTTEIRLALLKHNLDVMM